MNKRMIVLLMAFFISANIWGCALKESGTGSSDVAADTKEDYVKFPEFAAVTITGEEIDVSVFAEQRITMVNIWGTFCGPCISEMPDLAELHSELPEGSALMGVLTDVYGESPDNLDKALAITKESGVTYANIIPDEPLYEFLAENITGVPTTLYVDSEGNILGGIVGARSKEEYTAILEELLKELP